MSMENLTRVLQIATKKRSMDPAQLLAVPGRLQPTTEIPASLFPTSQSVDNFFAKAVSTVLVQTERSDMTNKQLEQLICLLMKASTIYEGFLRSLLSKRHWCIFKHFWQ